jgi:hypothetical protein
VWQAYSPTGGGAPAAHHVSHEPGGADALAALSASILTSGTLPDARLSANVPRLDAANVFTAPTQTVSAVQPRLILIDQTQSADARVFRVVASGQLLHLDAMNDAQTVLTTSGLLLDRLGNAKVAADLYEKGRATALGHWVDFTPVLTAASGIVSLTTVTTCRFTLIGKTLGVAFVFTLTPSAATSVLFLNLPVGVTSLGVVYGTVSYAIGAVTGTGVLQCEGPGAGRIVVARDFVGATLWTAATATQIGAMLFIPIT